MALAQAENALATVRRERVQALAELSLTLGVEVAVVAGALPEGKLPDATDTEARLPFRHDVLEAELVVREDELALAAALRETLPQGSLELGYASTSGTQGVEMSAGLDTRSFQPSLSLRYAPDTARAGGFPIEGVRFAVSLGLTLPFDPAQYAALEATELALAGSVLEWELALELARLDVSGKRAALEAALATRELAGKFLEQSRAVLEAARSRFELGLISVLDFKEAELSAAEAASSYAEAQGAVLLAQLALARALALDPSEVF